MARKVITIPQSININSSTPLIETRKRKVCAYARVSTDSLEQQTSYDAQVNYYTTYIKGREDWDYVDTYADEGISGTSTKKRNEFNRMVKDALAGKIDLIITKSVSRFARNTVDTLTIIRKLKEEGVECYFEKENIWTFDGKGELLLTIMSSLAQEESRSISENVKWGKRKSFADGKVSVPYSIFLGYDKGSDGNLVVNEEQAVIVRKIYKLFISGNTVHSIAKHLTDENIPTPAGKTKWSKSTVDRILKNEKYIGSALLQKSYTVDFLTKKKKKNTGEIPQYLVEDNHEPIISNEVYKMAQQEFEKRKAIKGRYSGTNILASKIFCGDCGHLYGAKVWHSNSKYRRVIYQCSHKFKNDKKCKTRHLYKEEIEKVFIKAVNQLIANKEDIINNIELVKNTLCDYENLKIEKEKVNNEMAVFSEMIQELINENARISQNQELYQKKYNKLYKEYENLKKLHENIETKISNNLTRNETLSKLIKMLKNQQTTLTEFDENLWGVLLDKMTVYNDDTIDILFKNGIKLKV